MVRVSCFRKLGLDLVPRQGAHMVDPESMSVIELYHVVILILLLQQDFASSES
jgi:hypothetical protein